MIQFPDRTPGTVCFAGRQEALKVPLSEPALFLHKTTGQNIFFVLYYKMGVCTQAMIVNTFTVGFYG